MEDSRGPGVSVVTLFELLALLGITHRQVADLLHTSRPNVTMWARGRLSMPRKHLEAIERFTWHALSEKIDAYWAAMDEVTGNGPGYPLGDSAKEPLLFKPPPPDAPPVVQQWWDFHVRSWALMDAWDEELQQEQHKQTVKTLIRQLGKVALDEEEKLDAMIESSADRRQLLDWFAQGYDLLQALERFNARAMAARLRTALQPRRQKAPQARAQRGSS
jgi:hypothetical protein